MGQCLEKESDCVRDSRRKEGLGVDDVLLLKSPKYKVVRERATAATRRGDGALLEACWDQDWNCVRTLLADQPHLIFCVRESGRTCLHLALFPGVVCPEGIIDMMIDLNPHAVLGTTTTANSEGETPLHLLFQSTHRNNEYIVKLLLNSYLWMMQEYNIPTYRPIAPTSPLLQSPLLKAAAAQVNPNIINLLLETRKLTNVIAPITGAETYFEEPNKFLEPFYTMSSPAEEFPRSPLTELWSKTMTNPPKTAFNSMWLSSGAVDVSSSVPSHISSSGQQSTTTLLSDAIQEMRELLATAVDESVEALLYHSFLHKHLRWSTCLLMMRDHIQTNLVHTVACLRSPVNTALLKLICSIVPEQVTERDDDGRLPLHNAILYNPICWQKCVRWGYKESICMILLQSYPESLLEPLQALYPFFLAATSNVDLSSLYWMIRHLPESIDMQRMSLLV